MLETTLQLLVNILVPTLIYGLLAAGFTVIFSVTHVLDLAVGAVGIAAGYVFFALSVQAGMPLVLAAIIAVAGAVILELLIAALVYEPLRRKRVLSTAISLIAAISALHVVQNILLAIFGPLTQSFARLDFVRTYEFWGVTMTNVEITVLGISIVVLILLGLFLYQTKIGKALRATSDHEEVAEIIGINVRHMRYVAFAIGGLVVGIGGVLFALQFNLEPNMPLLAAGRTFTRAVLGGIGSIPGALVGSLITEIELNTSVYFINLQAQEMLYFITILLILLWRPRGIFGKRD